MRTAALVVLVVLFVALPAATPPSAEAQSSEVTITLSDYDALRSASETPSATVIDSVILGGSFRDRNLTIALSGRTTGKRPLAKALEQMNDVTIFNCRGDGIVSRSARGTFELIPLAPQFEVRCDLRMSGSDRLRMHATSSVLAVRSTVEDGELVAGDEDDAGARDYTLVRQVTTGGGAMIAATATGRYRITLLPDATRFRYTIDVHNPNRTTSTLELRLQSDEHLQQIDSAAPYEVRDGTHVFSIPPGDSTMVMTGELRGTSFAAPVAASLQYLVIESHPLLRPTVETPARRISLGETGITPQYRGALAFETGSARIGWRVARLETLHAISYAVNAARHRFFIPLDGPILGETRYALRNEGAAELLLQSDPEPTYVAFGDEPVLMTKNAKGQLAVPLSPGEQNVLVQHRQNFRRVAGLAFGTIAVPHLDVPATQTEVNLSYPKEWVPLYEHFASRAQFGTPSGGQIFLLLVLLVWIERLLAWADVPVRPRVTIAILLSLAASLLASFLLLTVLFFGALTVAWILTRPSLRERIALFVLAGCVLFGIFLFRLGSGFTKDYEAVTSTEYSRSVDIAAADTAVVSDTATGGDAPSPATPPPVATAPPQTAYQGLPAKFVLPSGQRWTSFRQELLRTDRPQRASIVAISLTVLTGAGLVLGMAAILLILGQRKRLAAIIDRLRQGRRPADAAAPSGS